MCLELKGCESGSASEAAPNENFFLSKPESHRDGKKYVFFGMHEDSSSTQEGDRETPEPVPQAGEGKIHKSVIYVDNFPDGGQVPPAASNVLLEETVDGSTSLVSVQDSNVISVVFRNNFSFAMDIINDVHVNDGWSDVNSEDFPLGIEADVFNRIAALRRDARRE